MSSPEPEINEEVSNSDTDEDVPAPPTGNSTSDSATETTVLTAKPTIKPTLIRLAVVLLATVAIAVYFRTNLELLGSPELTAVASLIVLLAGALLSIRYLVRILVRKKTAYIITEASVKREYQLFFRTRSKAVRFDKLRSHQLQQNRIQSVLGFGTISLNKGLGEIRLADVADPQSVYAEVQSCARGVESGAE